MPHLKELVQNLLSSRDLSARAFAERTGIGYPTVLALLHKGGVPRKPEHREILRRELGLGQEAWAAVVALSQKDGIDIPAEGPLTLRQLVLKALLAQGFTEQSFARASGVPYATLMGLTRKGAIPRADTLAVIAERLGLEPDEIADAVAHSRTARADADADAGDEAAGDEAGLDVEAPDADAEDEPAEDAAPASPTPRAGASAPEIPNLAQLVADRIAQQEVSVAAFAREHGIPYLSLNRLITSGQPPRRRNVLEPLARALGLSESAFASSLQRSKEAPTPAQQPREDEPATPLQAKLQEVVKARSLTTKAFAELADLSVLTATKLLKHGDLPGRTTTHEKLRALLQLTQAQYDDLIERSRGAEAEAARASTASYAVPAPVVIPTPPAGTPVASSGEGPTVAELAELIERLTPRQRSALKQFILTMI